MPEIITLVQQYFIPFILILSVVVFVHEYGHFWVARRCGVKVETFSIGFGPELFGWHDRHGTRWKFSLLPLGGFVKMYGDADPASATRSDAAPAMTDADRQQAFFAQPVAARAAIVAAGPAANYVFAIIVMAVLFVLHGQPFSAPVVGAVLPDSAAAAAGLREGDRIERVDGQRIERFEDIQRLVSLNPGQPMEVAVQRDAQAMLFTITPALTQVTDRFGNEHRMGRLGISRAGIEYRQLEPLAAVGAAVSESWSLSVATLQGLGQIIMGQRSAEEIGGPLRIAQMSGDMSREGIYVLLWFIAVLSINLGLVNLLPVPMLDGGHLVFYAAEAARGRPLPERVQDYSARVGMALVLSLMVFATWNDLVQLRVFSF